MTKGKGKKYTGEFKQMVVETMHREKLGCRETMRRFGITAKEVVPKWEQSIWKKERKVCMWNVEIGLVWLAERKNRPRKPKQQIEEDLIAEVQRLRAENAYLKSGCRASEQMGIA